MIVKASGIPATGFWEGLERQTRLKIRLNVCNQFSELHEADFRVVASDLWKNFGFLSHIKLSTR